MRSVHAVVIFLLMTVPALAGQNEVPEDVLKVGGKAIVFFAPAWAEYVAMPDSEKDKIDEMLYDFYHYKLNVLPFLELHNIQAYSTARPKIQIQLADNKTIVYFRSGFQQVVGMIMTDGQHEPKIFLGAATDSDIIDRCYEFFYLSRPQAAPSQNTKEGKPN